MHLTDKVFKKCLEDRIFPDDLKDPITLSIPEDPVFFLGDKTVMILDAETVPGLTKGELEFQHPLTHETLDSRQLVSLPKLKEQIEAIRAARKAAKANPDEKSPT